MISQLIHNPLHCCQQVDMDMQTDQIEAWQKRKQILHGKNEEKNIKQIALKQAEFSPTLFRELVVLL